VLTSRLIDRPIRPLFPEGFYNEVQVVIHVLSLNPEVSADIAALIGSSAALAISGIPFNGPVGAARVGYVNGEYVLNPGQTALKSSRLDLVVAGTEAAVLMVESEAHQLSEEVMLGAVVLRSRAGSGGDRCHQRPGARRRQARVDWPGAAAKNEPLIAKVEELAEGQDGSAAYQIRSKQSPHAGLPRAPTPR
jgi:polyribonucleotide nucleotidyltransferase